MRKIYPKKKIIEKIILIDVFYRKHFRFRPKIAVLGLNPHCESIDKFNEDKKILKPTIKYLYSKNIRVKGPFSADTAFLEKNRKDFDVIVGMYHDQVLTPIKTLFEYDAIIRFRFAFMNFTRPWSNQKMLGQNKSNL